MAVNYVACIAVLLFAGATFANAQATIICYFATSGSPDLPENTTAITHPSGFACSKSYNRITYSNGTVEIYYKWTFTALSQGLTCEQDHVTGYAEGNKGYSRLDKLCLCCSNYCNKDLTCTPPTSTPCYSGNAASSNGPTVLLGFALASVLLMLSRD